VGLGHVEFEDSHPELFAVAQTGGDVVKPWSGGSVMLVPLYPRVDLVDGTIVDGAKLIKVSPFELTC
jgi:hypothetical protein